MTTHAQYRAVTERRTLVNTVLNAAVVGAVSTSVLRWNAAAIANDALGGWPIAAWVTELNDANLGTVLTVIRRGVYHVALGLTLETGANTAAGISFRAPPATLLNTAVPINPTAGIELGQELTTPLGTQSPFSLAVEIPISDGMAGSAAAAIRFHATAGSEGGIPTGIQLATARYKLTYIGDHMGS